MMSVYFPYARLYGIITGNDIGGLEEAIFFLGAKIHFIHVWCHRTSMLYAARLGHLKQAKMLLKELSRYSDSESVGLYVKKLFKEAISHADSDPDFLFSLSYRIANDPAQCKNYSPIEDLAKAGAFEMLERLVKEDKDRFIPDLIKYGFMFAQRRVLNMSETIQQHPAFLREMQKRYDEDPLELAIMQGDTEMVCNLLAKIFLEGESNCDFPSVKRSVSISADTEMVGKRIAKIFLGEKTITGGKNAAMFLHLALALDDLNLFKTLVGPGTIQHTLTCCKATDKKDMLETMLSIALYEESLTIIPVILRHENLESYRVNWFNLYHELIIYNKRKAAESIKHLVQTWDQKKRGRFYKINGNDKPAIGHIEADIPAEILVGIVETIDTLPRNRPGPSSQWRRAVTAFPTQNGRPDLVNAFQRYGVGYPESVVLNLMVKVSGRYFTKEWDTRPVNAFITSLDEVRLCDHFLGQPNADCIEISPSLLVEENERGQDLLKECVVETGRKMKLSARYHYASRMSKYEDAKEVNDQIESMRQASSNLKKICRLSVRNAVINRGESLTDAIVSLYMDGHLSKTLVNYLLYRDNNVHRPLYHRLVKLCGGKDVGPYIDESAYDDYDRRRNSYEGLPDGWDYNIEGDMVFTGNE